MNSNQAKSLFYRASYLFIVDTLLLLLGFCIALINPVDSGTLIKLVMFMLPFFGMGLSVVTFGFCIVEENGRILYLLVFTTVIAFLISASLWFAMPENPRLEPLTTLLALNAAFLGFLTSTSGAGIMTIQFRRHGRGITLAMTFHIPDEDDLSEADID